MAGCPKICHCDTKSFLAESHQGPKSGVVLTPLPIPPPSKKILHEEPQGMGKAGGKGEQQRQRKEEQIHYIFRDNEGSAVRRDKNKFMRSRKRIGEKG